MKKKLDFGNIAIKAGAMAGGVVLSKVADKPLENMKPALRGALKIAVGAIIPSLMPAPKGGKVNFVEGIGNGILATGVSDVYDAMTGKSKDETDSVEGVGDQFEEVWIDSEDVDEMSGAEDEVISEDFDETISEDFDDDGDDLDGLGD